MSDPRALWQGQTDAVIIMSPTEARLASLRLAKRAKWRAWRFYLGSLIWMPLMAVQSAHATEPLIVWGSLLLIVGGLVAIWEQAYHARADYTAHSQDFLEAYRRKLAKEARVARALLRWHMLPYIPGVGLIVAGAANAGEPTSWFVIYVGIFVLLYLGLRWRRARIARQLESELDALIGRGNVVARKGR